MRDEPLSATHLHARRDSVEEKMEGILGAISANTAKIAEASPAPASNSASRIQFALYMVNAPKSRLRDPEVVSKLAKIASKFDKVASGRASCTTC